MEETQILDLLAERHALRETRRHLEAELAREAEGSGQDPDQVAEITGEIACLDDLLEQIRLLLCSRVN